MKKDLERGERIKVDTGCLVAFEEQVDYYIEFGGVGIFITLA